MATSSYTQNSSALQNDLKIFVGKKSEIAALKSASRIAANKFYLAWDTGEIYFTSPSKQLIKYGGSNSTVTEDTVKELFASYSESDLKAIKLQLTEILARSNSDRSRVNALETQVDTKIKSVTENAETMIREKIEEVMKSMDDITYTKKQTETLIKTMINENDTRDNEQYVAKTDMVNYVTKSNLEEKTQQQIMYLKGDDIATKIGTKIEGMYFCTKSSVDGTYKKAHMYYTDGTSTTAEDLTPAGTGTVSDDSVKITLTLVEGSQTYLQTNLSVGGSFSGSKTFNVSITNAEKISSSLTLYENGMSTGVVITTDDTSIRFTATLGKLSAGSYTYTLSGVDRDGNIVKGTYIVKVIAPIYYGALATSSVPESTTILSYLTSKTTVVTDTYDIQTKSNTYIWICVPSTTFITSVTSGGFTVPFENPETQTIVINGISTKYSCYRSSEAMSAANVSLNVVGK